MTQTDNQISALKAENQQLREENQQLRIQLQEAQTLLRIQQLKAKKPPAFPLRRQGLPGDSTLTLAMWRWRTQWGLFLVIGIGIILAILLISSLPLFSDIMTTAGLRNTLRARPDSAQIIANAQIQGISSELLNDATTQVNNVVQQNAGQYLIKTPQVTLISSDWSALTPQSGLFDFYGVSIATAARHLSILQGRLPTESPPGAASIEIMLTQTAALYLGHLKVGDTFPLSTQLFTVPARSNGFDPSMRTFDSTIQARLVGIFQVKADDPYWNGYTLEAPPPLAGTPVPPYLGLTSQSVLLTLFDAIAQQHHTDNLYFKVGSSNVVFLSYMLDTTHITSSQLDSLIAHLGILQQAIEQTFVEVFDLSSNIVTVNLSGSALHGQTQNADSTLEKFRSQEAILQTPALLISVEVLCLILFFLSTIIETLVEREQAAIAILRSRGANRRQVLGSLLTQGLTLCLAGGLIGPLLALGLVYLLAPRFLTPTTQDALNALALDPGPALRALCIYTLIAVAAIFLTLFIFFYQAVRANILTWRREAARSSRLPLWQRLRLDLVVALLAIGGYVLSLYLVSTQSLLDAQSQALISTPLQLLAPTLLLLAGILFFFRFFPRFLRFLARLSLRRRGLNSMLAFSQMARSPHQPLRLTLLLGLAVAFALFSLIFSASQDQRAQDISNYQAISDFSGYMLDFQSNTPEDATAALNSAIERYQHIPGVTSATAGSITTLSLYINSGNSRSTILNAVDANSFAQTAHWSSQVSNQSLSELMHLLISQRALAIEHNVVPAIVTTSTWQMLNLSPGQTFNLNNENGVPDPVTYIAAAEVQHIAPIDDAHQGALMVDYSTLAAAKARHQATFQPNYVWLDTRADAAALNQVHQALSSSTLTLSSLVDRRALLNSSHADPLANNLLCLLSIGVSASLLLAFLANLLLPLLSVRTRQTNFAVLRALGTPPRQIASLLSWEMAIVLITALLLGLCFGTLLALSLVPPLIFTGVLPTNLVSISNSAVYTLQSIIPVTIVVPPSVILVLAMLIVLSLLALALLTRLARRPVMAQALRLDED